MSASIRIYALHCGGDLSDWAVFDPFDDRVGTKAYNPYFMYVVTHPRGTLLFDSGVHPQMGTDPVARLGPAAASFQVQMTADDQIDRRLALIGMTPQDVAIVVQSHLHFDHAGGLERLTHAPILVQRQELSFAFDPPVYQRLIYVRADFDHDLRWQELDGDHDVFGDGRIVVLSTPGHTRGHQSLMVHLDDGRTIMLLADAAYLLEKMRERACRRSSGVPTRWWRAGIGSKRSSASTTPSSTRPTISISASASRSRPWPGFDDRRPGQSRRRRRGTLAAEIEVRAAMVRRETIRLIGVAKSGHYTSVFSAAEILAALYSGVMRLGEDPDWPERDRLILSKRHVAVGVYPLLAERGYIAPGLLDEYTRLGNPLGDHPDMRRVPGIDFSSGSLGHGLSVGVGMAQAARMRRYEATRIWVLLGDQELNEGQVWEAAQSASHFRLGNLCAIVDRNTMGLDGRTEDVMSVEPIRGHLGYLAPPDAAAVLRELDAS